MKKTCLLFAGLLTALLTGCSSSSSSSPSGNEAPNSEKPTTVFKAVATNISQMAEGLNPTAGVMLPNALSPNTVDTVCDAKAQPLAAATSNEYAAHVFYCLIAKNTGSPDSLQGAYTVTQGVACAAQNAGLTFDGQTHSTSLTLSTACFPANMITGADGFCGNEASCKYDFDVTASKPAAGNSYYDTSIRVALTGAVDVTIYLKVSGGNVELAFTQNGSDEAFAMKLDTAAKKSWIEARLSRLGSGSNQFSRHYRMYVDLTDSGEVHPEALSGLFAETAVNASNLNEWSGRIFSMTGSMVQGGLTTWARQTSSAQLNEDDAATLNKLGTAKIACISATGPDSDQCPDVAPLTATDPTAPHKFFLVRGHTDAATWAAGLGDMTFTTVTEADTQ